MKEHENSPTLEKSEEQIRYLEGYHPSKAWCQHFGVLAIKPYLKKLDFTRDYSQNNGNWYEIPPHIQDKIRGMIARQRKNTQGANTGTTVVQQEVLSRVNNLISQGTLQTKYGISNSTLYEKWREQSYERFFQKTNPNKLRSTKGVLPNMLDDFLSEAKKIEARVRGVIAKRFSREKK